MSNYFHWFDQIFVISHPITKREEGMRERLSEIGIDWAKFVYAERPEGLQMSNMRRNPTTEFGCNLSQIKAVVNGMYAKRPLFLEDDVEFHPNAPEILEKAIKSLPDDWNVLYLGGHPCDPVIRVSDSLVKVGRFSFAESYAINGPAMGKFFDYWCDRIGRPNAMYDRILGEFARDNASYCVFPPITSQPAGFSFIANKHDDKADLVRRGWENNS